MIGCGGCWKDGVLKMYLKVLLNLPSFLQLFVLIAYVIFIIFYFLIL